MPSNNVVPPIVTAVAGKLYNPGCVTVRGAAAAAIARARVLRHRGLLRRDVKRGSRGGSD